VEERRSVINQQCDSLINEVEVKREFFLSDLEYEEKSKCECLTQLIDGWRQEGTSVDNLMQYTRDVLRETDPCAFIQVSRPPATLRLETLQTLIFLLQIAICQWLK